MSEENNNDDQLSKKTQSVKTQPLRKTSAVPLRKETVRVTLKSSPLGGGKTDGPPVILPTSSQVAAPAPRVPVAPFSAPMTPAALNEPKVEPHTPKIPDLPDVTTAVPLKQETMRVTLKADPAGVDKKVTPPPAPTIPLGGAPAPKLVSPAPTIPLGGAPAPKLVTPAPTVPLNVGPSVTGPATVPLATTPLIRPGVTQGLPKATVQLNNQTQQLSPASSIGNMVSPTKLQIVDEESSSARGGSAATVLAVAAFLVSLFVVYAQFKHASIWVEKSGQGYGEIFTSVK